jgi:hypothetical protein
MKRLLITEDEKKHIINLYEKIGDKLSPESLNSKKAAEIKKVQQFFNDYYKGKITPLIMDGDWNSKGYNDTLEKFLNEKGVKTLRCTKEDNDFCQKDMQGRDMEGIVYTTQVQEFPFVKGEMDKFYNTSKTTDEKINTTFDQYYDYMLKDGKYYFKGKGNTAQKYPNWIEATGKSLDSIKAKVKF